jgi:hypothetical protein
VAYEIDRMVEAEEDAAEPFPYRVLREFARVEVRMDLPRIVLVACGAIALQTIDPPRAIYDMFSTLNALAAESEGRIAAGRPAVTPREMVGALLENTREQREILGAGILTDLEQLLSMHAGRHYGERAMRRVAELYANYLGRRRTDPLWELRPFDRNVVERRSLATVLASAAPCDVLQEREPRPAADPELERDSLIRFGGASEVREDSSRSAADDPLRVLQCQIHYVVSHRTDTTFANSDRAAEQGSQCPFYAACSFAPRRQHADVCRERPWMMRDRSGEESCWYSAAAGSVLFRSVAVGSLTPTSRQAAPSDQSGAP